MESIRETMLLNYLWKELISGGKSGMDGGLSCVSTKDRGRRLSAQFCGGEAHTLIELILLLTVYCEYELVVMHLQSEELECRGEHDTLERDFYECYGFDNEEQELSEDFEDIADHAASKPPSEPEHRPPGRRPPGPYSRRYLPTDTGSARAQPDPRRGQDPRGYYLPQASQLPNVEQYRGPQPGVLLPGGPQPGLENTPLGGAQPGSAAYTNAGLPQLGLIAVGETSCPPMVSMPFAGGGFSGGGFRVGDSPGGGGFPGGGFPNGEGGEKEARLDPQVGGTPNRVATRESTMTGSVPAGSVPAISFGPRPTGISPRAGASSPRVPDAFGNPTLLRPAAPSLISSYLTKSNVSSVIQSSVYKDPHEGSKLRAFVPENTEQRLRLQHIFDSATERIDKYKATAAADLLKLYSLSSDPGHDSLSDAGLSALLDCCRTGSGASGVLKRLRRELLETREPAEDPLELFRPSCLSLLLRISAFHPSRRVPVTELLRDALLGSFGCAAPLTERVESARRLVLS
ncbi:hypothetical protein GNI_171830, partial [Gregarina niphandrodes]